MDPREVEPSSNDQPKVMGENGCYQRRPSRIYVSFQVFTLAKSSEPIKWQDSNTPTLTPYKAFSGALLL